VAEIEIEDQIREMVHRETRAWDAQDADALVEIFHPDMVWPWPPDDVAHDPIHWVFPQGRFDRERWRAGWQALFDAHALIHNNRKIVRVAVSEQQDGAFAVVDVDTLWRNTSSGALFHWSGRACKGYTLTVDGWKLIFHTGLLRYEEATVQRVAGDMAMRSLERASVRTRESGVTTSAWRMTIQTGNGMGSITFLDSGAYRGDGPFMEWSQEQMRELYRALATQGDPPPQNELQQWG
jgi:ketosteroid isomerase-like protein